MASLEEDKPSHIEADEPVEETNVDEDASNAEQSNEESDGGTESESSDGEPVQSLVSGREKRDTAGKRMNVLLEQEADEDIDLLFAEADEEDIEFEDPDAVEASGEEEDDGSSDDEGQGPTAGDDELEGEAQLRKEERAERKASKRKADKVFARLPVQRKRVKAEKPMTMTETTSTPTPSERPRKKSDRVSWVPSLVDAPSRVSSRTLAVENKERTLAHMKETDERRARQLQVLQQTRQRKEAAKKQPMTQAERLAEARRTEEENSRTLNKWEEMEQERVKKQKARLEALQHRRLEGPVIRWYSGRGSWVNGTLKHVGKAVKVEEPEGVTVSPKRQQNAGGLLRISQAASDGSTNESGQMDQQTIPQIEAAAVQPVQTLQAGAAVAESSNSIPLNTPPGDQHMAETLERIETISHAISPNTTAEQEPLKAPEAQENLVTAEATPITVVKTEVLDAATSQTDAIDTSYVTGSTETQAVSTEVPDTKAPLAITAPPTQDLSGYMTLRGPPPTVTEHSTRNLVTLINFDPKSVASHDVQRRILFNWPASAFPNGPTPPVRKYTKRGDADTAKDKEPPRTTKYNKAYKEPEPILCAITMQPAKYKDPETGLPYATVEGYQTIRRLLDGGYVWSDLLGAFVGKADQVVGGALGGAATGVPDGFIQPRAAVTQAEAAS